MGYARRVESLSLKHEFEMNSECSVGLGDAPSCCPIVIIITQRRRGLATCEGVMTTTGRICTQMKLSREFLRLGWCAGDIWIGDGAVSRRTDQFEMAAMLHVIDEQLLLLMERKTHLLSRVGLGSGVSLKDQLSKINEEIFDLKEAAQWAMTRQEEIDDFLAYRT